VYCSNRCYLTLEVKHLELLPCRILGENHANLPKLVDIMVTVVSRGDTLITEDTKGQMAVLLKQMKTHLPEGQWDSMVMNLKPKQQEKLIQLL
jgi:hypothetical protein